MDDTFVPMNLVNLFQRAVLKTPHGVAVEHDDGTLTYAELDTLSGAFARRLTEEGLQLEEPVLLVTAHGSRNTVALLGILKAGGCYVPIDRATWSSQRIQFVLETVSTGRLIVNTTKEPFHSSAHSVIQLDDIYQLQSEPSDTFVARDKLEPSTAACIIFTSGSTGKPKGTIQTHEAIANYASTVPFNMDVQPGDRVLHILSVAFDASTGMLFSILGNSGTVVPATMHTLHERSATCTILASTPSILAALPLPSKTHNPFPLVHTVLLGGETPPLDLLRSWHSVGVKILNAWGPTETTTASTVQIVEMEIISGVIRNSIIGKPMPLCPVVLLDQHDSEVEDDNMDGEIVVSGCSLARGYYNDPAKTAEKFPMWQNRRIYRTGDIGRWIRNNDHERVLEFRGRKDRIIKNRGFLVNLEADVEASLQQHCPGIESVYAIMFQGFLVALITPSTLDPGSIKRIASECLSSFHVPDLVVPVERLPLSANGKIDPQGVTRLLAAMRESEAHAEQQRSPTVAPSSLGDVLGRSMAAALGVALEDLPFEADFFAMGGNSLAALKFVSLCRAEGVSVSPRDLFEGRTWRRLSELSIPGDPEPRELANPACPSQQQIPNSRQIGPLTQQQLELCMPTLACPGKNCNQLRKVYDLTHSGKIIAAWQRVWCTEPLFRTEISLEEGHGVQIVHPASSFAPSEASFSDLATYISALEDASLDVGLGMRLDFIKHVPGPGSLNDGEICVIWTVHHALLDGYSLSLILAQVDRAYGDLDILPSEPFINAASDMINLQQTRDDEARSFWSTYLGSVPAGVRTDSFRTDMIEQDARAKVIQFNLEAQFGLIEAFAAKSQTTIATLYHLAWALALSRLTDETKIVVGVVHSGRHALLAHVQAVGQLMNTLPLIVHLDPQSTVTETLQTLMGDVSRCAEYSWSTPSQVNYRVSNLLAMQYGFPEYEQSVPALRTSFYENTSFPLNLLADPDAHFRLSYDRHAHSESDMTAVSEHFKSAVIGLLNSDKIGACMYQEVTSAGAEEVNMTPFCISESTNLVQAWEASARRHATLLAVESSIGKLSYSDLDCLASTVSQAILNAAIEPGPVAIFADGSINWIVGILGILKSGHAYCPIDPSYLAERRASVYLRSGSKALVLPTRTCICEVDSICPGAVTFIVEGIERSSRDALHSIGTEVDPDADALIVFTSGTTGQPKGVPLSHRGLLALQSNREATMFSRPGLRIAQFMSPAFDYCANEILSALLHGGVLVLRNTSDPVAHLRSADAATITPSVLSALDPSQYPDLKIVYATGEPVSPNVVNAWAPGRLFYNAYGPAECSICTSFTRLEPGEEVTIGRPINTARMYVLDENMQQLGVGAQGEIYLAGIQVMRGYLNAEAETKRKVLPDPWHPGSMMYRTGDYGHFTSEGNIFYTGRIDRQVKIRGYRVELAAVENQIYRSDSRVNLAAVLVANENLVAFVQPHDIDTDRLRDRLSKSLQPSWVPHFIKAIDSLPRTFNQKVDTTKLREMLFDSQQPSEVVEPCDELETSVAGEWRHVLNLPLDYALSASHEFQQVGGNSVLQMLLSVRLSKKFQVPVSVRHIILAPSIRAQAAIIRNHKSRSLCSEEDAKRSETCTRRLSYLEQQSWFQYQIATTTTTFNISVLLHLEGAFDRCKLIDAFNRAMAARVVLRSNFVEVAGELIRILRCEPPRVQTVTHLEIEAELNTEFDLSSDALFRVVMTADSILILTSHAIADMNSIQVLLRDVSKAYLGLSIGVPRFNYLKSAAWPTQTTDKEKRYWLDVLKDLPQRSRIQSTSSSSLFEGKSILEVCKGPVVGRLRGIMAKHSVTRHQVACSAIAQMFQWFTQSDDVVLGAPHENRHSELARESVGLFLDRIPLRIKTASQATCSEILTQARDVTQQAIAHAMPFHDLLELLRISPTLNQHPIFQVMVTFHLRGTTEDALEIAGCAVRREHCHSPGAKFLIMFEWSEIDDDEWALRIEYDDTRIDEKSIARIQRAHRIVLESLSHGMDRESIHESLNNQMKAPATKDLCRLSDKMIFTIRREMAACLNTDMAQLLCTQHFFDAGGNSMTAVRLQRRLKKVGLDIPLKAIFDMPTAERLAGALLGRWF